MKHSILTYLLTLVIGILIGVLTLGMLLNNPPYADIDTPVSKPMHFNKTMELEHFRSNDGCVIPIKIKVTYDSLSPHQVAKLRNDLYFLTSNEAFKWTIEDILQKDSEFGSTLAMLINDGNRSKELIQIDIVQLYSDRDKYIDEHFSKETADKLKIKLEIKESTQKQFNEQNKKLKEAVGIIQQYQQKVVELDTKEKILERKRIDSLKIVIEDAKNQALLNGINKTHAKLASDSK